jgi:hypothetical protein
MQKNPLVDVLVEIIMVFVQPFLDALKGARR